MLILIYENSLFTLFNSPPTKLSSPNQKPLNPPTLLLRHIDIAFAIYSNSMGKFKLARISPGPLTEASEPVPARSLKYFNCYCILI